MSTPPPSPGDARNVTWHHGAISSADRESLLGQRGCVVWLTGLSGSGKSTLARAIEARLSHRYLVYVLDGDNLRHGLSADLGFRPEDREENIRRIGEVAALFADAGVITVVAFISPYRAGRARARAACRPGRFLEVHVNASVDECERRDPKQLYERARRGEIAHFTGISAPYEPPVAPELTLDTERANVMLCVDRILRLLRRSHLLERPREVDLQRASQP